MVPDWQTNLEQLTEANQNSVFLVHGAIRDRIRLSDGSYSHLNTYLRKEVFAQKDYFIVYDPAHGIDFPNKDQKREFLRTLEAYDSLHNTSFAANVPKHPHNAFLILENFCKLQAMNGKSAVVVIDYLEDILPQGERSYLSNELRYCLVAVDKWAREPSFLRKDISFIFPVENLSFLDTKITRSPFIPKLEILLPTEETRRLFLEEKAAEKNVFAMDASTTAQLSAGLSLLQLERMVSKAVKLGESIDAEKLKDQKKEMIESECLGLLEFVEPKNTLDVVAGHDSAKRKLRQASKAVHSGHTEVLPMGYLICGPVGTGKTFLVTSFAGEIGVPVVELRNFRSQWVGATEANLEKILNLLKSMWPVAVIIDEADAALGTRQAGGDSGTSARVFARLISFMGDTSYRGKIIWFLITSRPDLLPIDVKRQGRAEEHFALFYPHTSEDRQAMFEAMCRKTGVSIKGNIPFDKLFKKDRVYSGADMEAVLTRVKFEAVAEGVSNQELDPALVKKVVNDFIPPTYPDEVDLQNMVAIRECTSAEMIPAHFAKLDTSAVQTRINALRAKLGE